MSTRPPATTTNLSNVYYLMPFMDCILSKGLHCCLDNFDGREQLHIAVTRNIF